MIKTLLISTVVLTLLFGTIGVGVAAAKTSEPGDPLYGLKTWVEQIQLQNRAETQNRTMEQLRLEEQYPTTATPSPLMDQLRVRDQDRLHQLDQDRTQERDQDRIHQTDQTFSGNNWNGYGSNGNAGRGNQETSGSGGGNRRP
jgi:hypothetical protein